MRLRIPAVNYIGRTTYFANLVTLMVILLLFVHWGVLPVQLRTSVEFQGFTKAFPESERPV